MSLELENSLPTNSLPTNSLPTNSLEGFSLRKSRRRFLRGVLAGATIAAGTAIAGVAGGFPGKVFASPGHTTPSSTTPTQAGSTIIPKRRYAADYTIHTEGNLVKAVNGTTGAVDYSDTDAKTVIQTAIDSLTNGGLVLLKAGTYTISGTISVRNNSIGICGEGPSTVLTIPNNSMGAGFRHVIYVQAHDFELRDLQIDGNQTNQSPANYVYLVQLGTDYDDGSKGTQEATRWNRLAVRNCTLVNAVSGHIRCFKCQYVTIENNFLQTVTGNESCQVKNIMMGWVWDFEIKNNYCDLGTQRLGSNNIMVQHSGNTNSGSIRGKVVGNTCVNCTDSPIEVSSSSARSCLKAYVEDIVITKNTVRSGAGIISLQAHRVDITENKIIGPGAGAGNAWGIRTGCSVNSDTTVACRDINIVGNIIQGDRSFSRQGIRAAACGGAMQGITVANNEITDIADPGVGIQIDGSDVPSPNHTTDITITNNTMTGVSQPLQIVNTVSGAAITVT